LQDLPTIFENYLNNNVYDSLLSCGDYEYNQSFDIIKNNDHKQTIQLGRTWNIFCCRNHFNLGCTIRFKFTL